MNAADQLPWTSLPGAVVVNVRLTPRGGRDAIDGIERRADGSVVLKARVRAAPFEGEANAALCRLLAKAVGVAPRQVTLIAGETARVKRVRIAGETARLEAALRKSVEEDADRSS